MRVIVIALTLTCLSAAAVAQPASKAVAQKDLIYGRVRRIGIARSVPIGQAVAMVARLAAVGVQHRFVHYTDRGHMGISEEVIKEARAFIGEVERSAPPR